MGKEDTKKAMGLAGAVVAVFACAGWRIVGATKPAPAPPPVETTTVASTTGDSTTPKVEEVGDEPIEVPSVFGMGSPDPFKWLVKPDHGQLTGKPFTSSTPISGSLPAVGPMTPLPAAGFNLQPAKEPEVRLTGVLPGPNAVAVVEVGDTSYVVRKGERFGNGYTLDTIGTDRVALVRGGKRTRLLLDE